MSGAPIYEKISGDRYRLAGHCVNGRFVRASTLKTCTVTEICLHCRAGVARCRCAAPMPPVVAAEQSTPPPHPRPPQPTPAEPPPLAAIRTMSAAKQAVLRVGMAGVPPPPDTLAEALRWRKEHWGD
jgi:hypothetical protein